jgi:hypothetical protein
VAQVGEGAQQQVWNSFKLAGNKPKKELDIRIRFKAEEGEIVPATSEVTEQTKEHIRAAVHDMVAYFNDLNFLQPELVIDTPTVSAIFNERYPLVANDPKVVIHILKNSNEVYPYTLEVEERGKPVIKPANGKAHYREDHGGSAAMRFNTVVDSAGVITDLTFQREPVLLSQDGLTRYMSNPQTALVHASALEVMHNLVGMATVANIKEEVKARRLSRMEDVHEIAAPLAAAEETIVHAVVYEWFFSYAQKHDLLLTDEDKERLLHSHPGIEERYKSLHTGSGAVHILQEYVKNPHAFVSKK